MNKKNTISVVSLVLTVCLYNCGGENVVGDFLSLNVEVAIDNQRTFDLSEITSGIELIALDDSSEGSLIGNISIMRESRDRFYISDGSRNPVKVFDKAGKFLSTCGLIGRGPNELPSLGDIAVDYRHGNIYLMGGNSAIVAYDAEGNLFARNDSILQSAAIMYVDNKLVVLKNPSGDTPKPGGKTTFIELFSPNLQSDGNIDIVGKGLPREVFASLPEGGMMVFFINRIMSDNGSSILVKEPLNDTVFHYMNNRVLKPAYRLDFGSHTVPAGVLGTNPTVQWSNQFRPLRNIWEGDRYILATTVNYGIDTSTAARIVLDKHNPSGGLTALGPDGKPGLFHDGVKFTPCYIRDNRLVGYMQAIDIVDTAAAITNPDLKAIAATLKEDSNPVIVIAKLKNN